MKVIFDKILGTFREERNVSTAGLPVPTPLPDEVALWFNGWLYIKTTDEPGTYNWHDANTVCQNKGAGCYLPSKMELDFIYQAWNHPNYGGSYRGGFCPLTGFLYTYFYWSSTVVSGAIAWAQSFDDGSQNYLDKSNSYKVRCVRRELTIW
jgi:hypothetical protein